MVDDGNGKEKEPSSLGESKSSGESQDGREAFCSGDAISCFVIQESRRYLRGCQALDFSLKVDPAELAYKKW